MQAPCVDTDTSGDILYSRAVRGEGDVSAGGGGPGVWELLGGTGKYAGVTGTCSYETEYLESVLVTIRRLHLEQGIGWAPIRDERGEASPTRSWWSTTSRTSSR